MKAVVGIVINLGLAIIATEWVEHSYGEIPPTEEVGLLLLFFIAGMLTGVYIKGEGR